jgi:tripartite-type tricarboxylate transporter receptor subunit TctC
VTDLLAGQVQALFTGVPALLPHIKAGKMRALAVSSPKRSRCCPTCRPWPRAACPAPRASRRTSGTAWSRPPARRQTSSPLLNQQINKALASRRSRTRLAAEGAEPTPATPQAFGS